MSFLVPIFFCFIYFYELQSNLQAKFHSKCRSPITKEGPHTARSSITHEGLGSGVCGEAKRPGIDVGPARRPFWAVAVFPDRGKDCSTQSMPMGIFRATNVLVPCGTHPHVQSAEPLINLTPPFFAAEVIYPPFNN